MKITLSDLVEEKSRNNKLEFISKIGAVLLPPSLLAGLFGMNVLNVDETDHNQLLALVFVILSGIIGFSMTLDFKSILTYIKKFTKPPCKLKFNLKKIFLFDISNRAIVFKMNFSFAERFF